MRGQTTNSKHQNMAYTRMAKQTQQPKCDLHTDGMIDERSYERSPTPRCLLITDRVTNKISDEGSPTPKCDVDTDRLMRGQTKDSTNRNIKYTCGIFI